MRIDERAARMMRLLEYINEQDRPVPVSELAELASREFGVSEVTLRSDLAALSDLRSVRKLARGTYQAAAEDGTGGPLSGAGSLFRTRLKHRAESKIGIAAAVAEALTAQEDLRVLLLDAGTTAYYVADRLSEPAGLDLLVWTPSVAAAARLAGVPGVSVRLLGGEYHPDYAVVSGDETAQALRALAGREAADPSPPLPQFPGTHCVLDVNYVAEDGRLFTDESSERLQKRLMAELAEEVTVVADHSKLFGRRLGLQAHEVCALEQLREKRRVCLVTDAAATETQRETARLLLERLFPGREVTLEEREGAVILGVR
jgi:DeoR family transcriptional regulator, fructose operon transcriptional repressor